MKLISCDKNVDWKFIQKAFPLNGFMFQASEINWSDKRFIILEIN